MESRLRVVGGLGANDLGEMLASGRSFSTLVWPEKKGFLVTVGHVKAPKGRREVMQDRNSRRQVPWEETAKSGWSLAGGTSGQKSESEQRTHDEAFP